MNTWLVEQQLLLSQQVASGLLPHAILITGVNGVGKKSLSNWLTQLLICQSPQLKEGVSSACKQCKTCLLHERKTYPDHLFVTPVKNTIGVDNIRLVSQFFQKTAQIGKEKTALITEADLMTTSAANALLKTLEEPTPNSFIILTTSKADSLLPTIVSRCRLVDIRPPMGEQLINEIKASSGNAFTNITHIAELSNEDKAIVFQEVEHTFISYLKGSANRLDLLRLLTDYSDSCRWLEKILCDQVRVSNQWLNQTIDTNNTGVEKESKQQNELGVSQQCLLAMYQLVLSSNQIVLSLPQANSRFIIEKLLIDIDMMRISENQKGN